MKKAEVKAFLNHRGSGRELEGIQPARYAEGRGWGRDFPVMHHKLELGRALNPVR